MKYLIALSLFFFSQRADAQITKASLQASGLTCSMCSRAVKQALEGVPFVSKVTVDIKNQRYNLSFREGANVDLDQLGKAVDDAGFSVAALQVTANLDAAAPVEKDRHVRIGQHYYHFLNADGRKVKGPASFSVVDRNFVPAKDFARYAAMTKMSCVKTGKASSCCTEDAIPAEARIYHVIL